jgi:RNA polymerase sigma-70 factor, ECF subfamily
VLGVGGQQHASSARITLEERIGPRASWSPDERAPVDRMLLERYMRAWESGDLEAIVALLHDEVTLSMPPIPRWVAGRHDVGRFFGTHTRSAMQALQFRAIFVEANGAPGIGFYRVRGDGTARFFAVHLVEVKDGRIALIDHFMSTSSHAAFFAAGLAPAIDP